MKNSKQLFLFTLALSWGLNSAKLQAQQHTQLSETEQLKVIAAIYAGIGLVSLSVIGFERYPKTTVGAWAIATAAFLIKRHLDNQAFENRPDTVVLEEAQVLINTIKNHKLYQLILDTADKITPDLSEDQRAVFITRLRKYIFGLGYTMTQNYWHACSTDYSRLNNQNSILQKRIVKRTFNQPADEKEKAVNAEILERLKSIHEEIETLKLRIHKLMTEVKQIA